MLKKSFFKKINIITLGSVLVLILVGSIVRSQGAGMGCPDWPKCFGEYVPPTSAEYLPDNYQDIFRNERLRKNQRVSKLFASLGYKELSEQIINDPSIAIEKDFDVTKAWIEYVNRLIGVLIGLFVLLNLIFSFAYWKDNKWIPIAGISIFILTGFQGWIGSLVVSTNLLDGFITFHLLVAFLILALLIWQNVLQSKKQPIESSPLFYLALALFVFFIPQILLGTDVRAIVDQFLFEDTDRSLWSAGLDRIFFIHRSYSWIILVGAVVLLILMKKSAVEGIKQYVYLLIVCVVVAMLAGIGMVQFDFPFWLQPLHMIMATGIFATLFYLILRIRTSK